MRRGYITVFFAIAISLCLSLILALVYGVRESAIRQKIKESADVCIRSTFAEYQRELWENYNLIFVDSGYGSKTPGPILSEEHFKNFMNKNFNENPMVVMGGKDFLSLTCNDVETMEIRFATDENGKAVLNQAVKWMRYKYGIVDLLKLYEKSMDALDEYSEDEYREKVEKAKSDIGDSPPFQIEEWISSSDEFLMDRSDVSLLSSIRLIYKDISFISEDAYREEDLIESRNLNKGNIKQDKESDLADKLFFTEYVLSYCGNFVSEMPDTALKYESEYLITGMEADAKNIESMVNLLLVLRTASNATELYKDKVTVKEIEGLSQAIATLCLNPELAKPIAALIEVVWIFNESKNDVWLLLSGEKVPLGKAPSEWKTTFLNPVSSNHSEEGYEEGFSYKDYLRMFLYTVDIKTLTNRFMNVCEQNVRKSTNNPNFRLDNCFDAWKATSYVTSDFGYEYMATRKYDIEE